MMKGFIKKMALIIAILTSGCIVFLIGVFFLFHSSMMQKAMEKSLYKYIQNKTEGRVSIEGLHLSFPNEIRIDSVAILNENEVQAQIEGLELGISLWLLPFSEFNLSSLTIDSFKWLDISKPATEPKPSFAEQLSAITWPKLPAGIKINHYDIKSLILSNTQSPLSFKGSVSAKKMGGDIHLITQMNSKEYGSAELNCLGKANKEHIYIKAKYDPAPFLKDEIKDLTLKAQTSFKLKDLQTTSSQAKNILSLAIEGRGLVNIDETPVDLLLNSKLSIENTGFVRLDRLKISSPFIDITSHGSLSPQSLEKNSSYNIFKIYQKESPLSIDWMFTLSPKITTDYLTNPVHGSFKGLYKEALSGAISLETIYKSIPVTGSSVINWNLDNDVEFKDITVESRESLLSGNLEWDIAKKGLFGQINGSLLHFPFSAITHLPFQGDTDFKINFEKSDTLNFEFMLQNVSSNFAKVFKGHLSGSLSQYSSLPLLTLDAKLSNLFFKDIGVKEVEVHINSNQVSYPFSLQAKGLESTPFDILLEGTLDRKGDFITLDTIHGNLYGLPLTSNQSISLKRDKDLIELSPIQLFLGQGDCQLSGSFSNSEGVKWDCKLFKFPIKPLQYMKNFDFIEGSISGTSKVTLTQDITEGLCNLKIDELLFYPEMRIEEMPLQGSLSANINSHSLSLDGKFSGVGATPSKFSLELPLEPSKGPFGIKIAKNSPLHGSLTAEGDIQPISKLVLSDQDLLDGHWKGDFTLSGLWNNPILIGSGEFSDGHYENLTTGLSLKEISFEVSAKNQLFNLLNGSATCGKKGSIYFDGSIDLLKESLLDFSLDLQKTPILNIQDGSAIASGKLHLTGPLKDPVISGNIILNHLELLIPDESSDPLSLLNVEYVYPQSIPIEQIQTSAIPLRLKLNIDIGNESFIRGRGLNSKWKGNLNIEGRVDKPKIFGTFQLIRGEFAFSSTIFNLSEGKILFNDDTNNLGFLSITGESKTQDVNIYINLKGPLQSPSLSFSSSPSYPQNEILSLILFGSASQDTSPIQAIQVTQAVIQISKGYSNLDFINRIRQNIGLDQLSITSMDDDPSNLEVHVGKYLSQNIYIALARSLSASTKLISASLELFNSFSFGVEHIEMNDTQIVKDRLQAGWKHSY